MRAADAVERALRIVEVREATVRAWAYLDAPRARAEASTADCQRSIGLLAGTAFGAKDVFDTADQPTEYGSSIYSGHRPSSDAEVVVRLRQAGAVCLGKTVTAEFACSHPGPTRNPHRPDHTPGGSSMGSAAAVAAGMADFALGTQTAASIIRPGSFCGVLGFKPSYGAVSTVGLKPVAPSLDTVGWFAPTPQLLDTVRVCLTGSPPAPAVTAPPHLSLYRSEYWAQCSPDARRTLSDVARRLAGEGARVTTSAGPDLGVGLGDQVPIIIGYEAARSLTDEHVSHRTALSGELAEFLDWGASLDFKQYQAVLERKVAARLRVGELFGDAEVILTPAVLGEAPFGLDSTGDPRPARLWTLLELPTAVVPAGTGNTGLPIGVQLVGRPGGDGSLMAVTRWVSEVLAATGS